MIVAIDFDGVIHRYSKGWNNGEIYDNPVKGVKEALETLKKEGHTLYIFSTRTNKLFQKKDAPDAKKTMVAWLEKHKIPYDKIWTWGKPMAQVFIDDRAIGFDGDWSKTLASMKDFKPWYKKDTN